MTIGVLGARRMAEGLVPHWLAVGHDALAHSRTGATSTATPGSL